MFSYKAAQKLGEIFDVVFKAGPPSGDEGTGVPVINSLNPPSVPAGGAQPVSVRIIGEGLGKVSTVRVNDTAGTPDSVMDTEVSFTLQPADIAQPADIKIAVGNPDGTFSEPSTFVVTAAEGGGGNGGGAGGAGGGGGIGGVGGGGAGDVGAEAGGGDGGVGAGGGGGGGAGDGGVGAGGGGGAGAGDGGVGAGGGGGGGGGSDGAGGGD